MIKATTTSTPRKFFFTLTPHSFSAVSLAVEYDILARWKAIALRG